MQCRIVNPKQQCYDIAKRKPFTRHSQTTQAIRDDHTPRIQKFFVLHKYPISCNYFFKTILHIQDIQKFHPPWFLDRSRLLTSSIIRDNDIKFLHIDQSSPDINILQKRNILLTRFLERRIIYSTNFTFDKRNII